MWGGVARHPRSQSRKSDVIQSIRRGAWDADALLAACWKSIDTPVRARLSARRRSPAASSRVAEGMGAASGDGEDDPRLQRVLAAACLEDDLAHLPDGLDTIVAERAPACCRGHMRRAEPDDDIGYTLIALMLLERHGDAFDVADVARPRPRGRESKKNDIAARDESRR